MTANELRAVIDGLAPVIKEFVATQIAAAEVRSQAAPKEVETTLLAMMAGLEQRMKAVEQLAPVPGLRGEKGDPGPKGDSIIGPKGDRGEKGETGDPGPAGPKGADGIGIKGDRGDPGPAGPKGADGLSIKGEKGDPGDSGPIGAKGERGEKGDRGDTGPMGPIGQTGGTGADGLGLASALVDRDGRLVLTFSDGSTKDVGPVVGKDGADGMNGKDADPELMRSQIIRAVAAMPTPQDGAPGRDGTDGADGLGFDEMDCCFDEARGWLLRFTRGDLVREFELGVPFDAGEVWTAGKRYPKGAGVRRDGSWWIAQQPNLNIQPGAGTPQSSKAWKLAAKRGQDGNPGKDGKNGGDL